MDESQPGRTTLLALAFEGGLGLAALAAGWLLSHWPAIGMSFRSEAARDQFAAIGWGLVATLPLVVMLLLLDRFPVGPLKQLHEMAHDLIAKLFSRASYLQLAIVSLAA